VTMEERFFAFIFERQSIWYRRFVLRLPAPWTEDPILSTYKFCNMYRELDASTRALMGRLNRCRNRREQVLNIVFFRFFNLRRLYEDLGIDLFRQEETDVVLAGFERMRRKGQPIFNNAYIISPGHDERPKHVTILEHLKALDVPDLVARLDGAPTPEAAHEILMTIPCVGSFLAGEIWTDLASVGFFRQGWTDNDFVAIGPGAAWGLDLLVGRKLTAGEREEPLRRLHIAQGSMLPDAWRDIAYMEAGSNMPFLSLTNMEGALCEFRKYTNLSQGKGRRRYYRYS